eukprot:Tbor_TRINITY_DN5302_c0_g2::TRINITY_DN5302_c0_g2_i1::g.4116::m.4116
MSHQEVIKERQQLEYEEQTLQSELDGLNTKLKEAEDHIKNAKERRDKIAILKKESEVMQNRIRDTNEYLAEAQEAMKDFPNEQQMTRLENRSDALKVSLDNAEGRVQYSTTCIAAYAQRREKNTEVMLTLLDALNESMNAVVTQLQPNLEMDDRARPATEVSNDWTNLLNIDLAQEDRLQSVLKKLEAYIAEETQQNEEMMMLQAENDEQLPAIELEKDLCLEEITDAWNTEKSHLHAIYQRLITLNMEQHYHLSRGTHIKREWEEFSEVQEKTLVAIQDRLSSEAIHTAARLTEMKEDVTEINRLCEASRERGRRHHKSFQKLLDAKTDELAAAKEDHENIKKEAEELRNLRAELMMILQPYSRKPTPKKPKWEKTTKVRRW